MQTYFFVQRGFLMGGIETLILRVIPLINKKDSKIVISGKKDSDMTRKLPPETIVFEGENEFLSLFKIPFFIEKNNLPKNIIFVSFNPWSLVNVFIIRFILAVRKGFCVKSFYFVPHSRAMFFSGNEYSKKYIKKVFLRAPIASTYFMNDVALVAHEKEWKKSLKKWPVLRLPLDERKPVWHARKNDKLKIVSIGRLVPFKGYNRAAPEIVSLLRSEGIAVEWTIWGDGEDSKLIESLIAKNKTEDSVFLRGTLPYEKINEELEHHDLFVGMGTAMLEAGLMGIPTICALENGVDEGYGFLPDAPSDSVGDRKEGYPTEQLINTIKKFLKMNVAEINDLSKECIKDCQLRSASLSDFSDALNSASPWPLSFNLRDFYLAFQGAFLLAIRELKFLKERK